MNPRERLLAALRGEMPDRVPLIMEGFHYQSRDKVEDPAKHEILDRTLEQTHFFVNFPSYCNRYLVTPAQRMKEVSRTEEGGNATITVEIDTPKGKLTSVTGENKTSQTTWTLKYPVESLEDIEKIRSIPWELPEGLVPPDLSDTPDNFETRGILHGGVSSPFVCVAGMMPYEYFLELCATDFDLMDELTAQCLERILGILDVLLADKAIEYVWMGGSEWLTPPMGSPTHYERLVHRYEKKVIERIHEGGALSHVHCHGNVASTLEMAIERGADFFEPVEPSPDGDIIFTMAKQIAAGRITLGGNVEARILENEGPDEVEQAARAAFEGGGERMIFQTTAGPISRVTPKILENYHRLVDVWEELSTL